MGTHVSFERGDDGNHHLVDTAMNRRSRIDASLSEFRRIDADVMDYPVTTAWQFETDELVFRTTGWIVRDTEGRPIAETGLSNRVNLPDGLVVELDHVIKTYAEAHESAVAFADSKHLVVSFDSSTTVTLGARSYHTAPSGTLTTTPDVRGLAWAVSHFGSAVQTTAPERAFPTLRGHPPLVTLGDERSAEGEAWVAESEVTLAVERSIEAVLAAAPLAYYLGASVELSDRPRLEADGVSLPLTGNVPGTLERLLQHVFICDVAAREYGRYDLGTQSAEKIDELLDFERLRDVSHAERVATYLEAPIDRTLAAAPAWPKVTHVAPKPDAIEHLPRSVFDLAAVRPTDPPTYTGPGARRAALESFVGAETRSSRQVFNGLESFVELPETKAIHDVWVGDGIPLDGIKSLPCTERSQPMEDATGIVGVLLVCNDPEMIGEVELAREGYQMRERLPSEVTVHHETSTAELRDLLTREVDLFHFVGHATPDGLECMDGYLDTGSVPAVGATTFLLNACQSYPHAVSLVEGGARGGIVTLADVGNETALAAGRHVARALSRGYTIESALHLLRNASLAADVYSAVGDTTVPVAQFDGCAAINQVSKQGDSVSVHTTPLPNGPFRAGAINKMPAIHDGAYLVGSSVPSSPEQTEVSDYFAAADTPFVFDGELHWSGDTDLEELL